MIELLARIRRLRGQIVSCAAALGSIRQVVSVSLRSTDEPFSREERAPPGCICYGSRMRTRRKAAASTESVRQRVTIPATLVAEVQRVTKERHVTISRALVALAERGVR